MEFPENSAIIKVGLNGFILARGKDEAVEIANTLNDVLEKTVENALESPVVIDYDLDLNMQAAMMKDQNINQAEN